MHYENLFTIVGISLVLLVVAVQQIQADEMVHEFKSPSFNGVGTSNHYFFIDQTETNRKQAIRDEIQALQDEIEREKNNTVEARFMRNLTSRIYSNIAKKIEDALFGEDPQTSGSMELDGNLIEYEITDDEVKVTITSEDGTETVVIVPIGGFNF